MNENQNKTNNQPLENTSTSDFEIFDLDALRKSKTTTPQQPTENVAAKPKTPPIQQKPTPQSPTPNQTAPRTPQNNQTTPRVPQNNQTTPRVPQKKPQPVQEKITDIKPDRVVFDSANGKKRNPLVRKPKIQKEKKIKPITPYEEKERGANPIMVLSKALIYIAAVLLVSCVCAYYIVTIANDVFAFVKADAQIEVVIPEYATLDQIADELHDKKVITYPKMFVLYTMIRGSDPGKYLSGKYEVSPSQNYDELLWNFIERKSTSLTEISVTIPEGFTVDDIINLLVNENGVGTKEGFVDAIQNGEYDYWFVKDLTNTDPNRKYRLEGYLYPDTYYIYKESEETAIINKMLANFHSKFNIEYKQECEKAGMSVDQVVNLASLIQMEAKYPADYSAVSSVLHNRLNSSYYGYKLESCATVQYVLPERKARITNEDTQIDNPYNTYRNGGLPPGPISNPTLKAIRAALYPDQSNYYFFVNDMEGNMHYAKTYNEHLANKAKVDAEWDAAGTN